MKTLRRVIVASENPVKLNAVKSGFQKMFSENEFEFVKASVPSDVHDQPLDNDTTLKGALNRANNAKALFQDADFWIGVEGGIEKSGSQMSAFAWVVIISGEKMGKARTGTFFLPKKVIELIEAGKELGEADDIVFGHSNSKQKNGAVGILTKNIITRTSLYTEAVVLALVPFKNPEIY